MGSSRNHWLDNAKFVLIVLVILGHCLDRLGEGHICASVNTSMAFFRMPAFIFLSGFFSKKTDWKRFLSWTWGVLETYLVITIIQVLPGFLQGKEVPLEYFIIPRWTLWYLLSLCFWRLFIQLLGDIRPAFWLLAGSVVIGALSGLVHLGLCLSLQRTFTMVPFFMLGYWCRCRNININAIRRIPAVAAVAILVILWIANYQVKDFELLEFLRGKEDFSYFTGYSLGFLVCLRLSFYVVSVVVSACVLRLVPQKESWLSVQGRDTLYYYVYHALFIMCLVFLRRGLVELPASLIAVIVYDFAIVAAIWLLLKIPFFRTLPRLFTKIYSFVFARDKKC